MKTKAPIRLRGRWVSRIAHAKVCAVISRNSIQTMVIAEELMGWPSYNEWRTSPDFSKGAA